MATRKNPASPPPATPDDPAAPSFEEAIDRLETIVEELEAGSLSLEESIARYEEGVRLSRRLTQTLDEAEKRIERLLDDENGNPATAPADLDAESPERAGGAPPAGGGRGRSSGPEELPF